MKYWTIQLHYNKKQLGNIIIKKGILQGDSLSPLLFILSIDIVSKQLNKNVQKATIQRKKTKRNKQIQTENDQIQLGHIFYMDDLKIITTSTEEMEKAHSIITKIFDAITLNINPNKCGVLLKGNIQIPKCLQNYPKVEKDSPYKYLGIELTDKIEIQTYMNRILEETMNVLVLNNIIIKEELSSINLIQTINTNIISKLRYGFSIAQWPLGQLTNIDANIRKCLIKAKIYGRGLCKSRLYVKLTDFGYGLKYVRDEYAKELLRIYLRFIWMESNLIAQLIHFLEEQPKNIWKTIIKTFKNKTSENELKQIIDDEKNKKDISKVMNRIDDLINNHYINEWKSKNTSDKIVTMLQNPLIAKNICGNAWKRLNINKKAWLEIIKMQEYATCTGIRKAMITTNKNNKYCGVCKDQIATIPHILLNCKKIRYKRNDIHDHVNLILYKK